MTRYTSLLILSSLMGCAHPNEGYAPDLVVKEVGPTPSSLDTIGFGPPVDINALKASEWLETTSGIVSKQGQESLCSVMPDGFFGFYFLIDRESGKGPFGKLTVQQKGLPENWGYDDVTEEFVEIELRSNRVRVWDRLAVGSRMDSLSTFLADRFHYKKGTVHVVTIGPYKSEFRVLSDTIHDIRIMRVCQN